MPKEQRKKSQNPLIARAEERGIDVPNVSHDDLTGAIIAVNPKKVERGNRRPRAMLDLLEKGLAVKGHEIVISTGDERNVPVVVVKVRDTDLVVCPVVNGKRSPNKFRVLPVHVIGAAN